MIIYAILSMFVVLFGVGLFYNIKRNFKLEDKLDELGEQIEESLDILNDCYQRIAKVAETPIAMDDPVIRQLLNDIRYVRHAILLIANKVVTFDEPEQETEDEQE